MTVNASQENTFRRNLIVAIATAVVCWVTTTAYQSCLDRADEQRARTHIIFQDAALQKPLSVLPQTAVQSLEIEQPKWTGVRGAAGRYTPIIRWNHVGQLPMSGDRRGYLAPGLSYDSKVGTARPRHPSFHLIATVLSSLLIGVAVLILCRRPYSLFQSLAGLGLLRAGSLIWTFALFGFFSIHAHDETFYFQTAQKLLNWKLDHGEYPYTLGNSLLYLPILLIRPHLSEFGFTAIYGFVYFVIFGIGIIACYLWLVRQFTDSLVLATGGGVILVLYPWLFRIFQGGGETPIIFTFFGLWLDMPVDVSFIDFYYYTDFVGYNAMSDTPALFFGLAGLVILQKYLRNSRSLCWPALILGFSSLIRLSNIFYLFPALFLIYNNSSIKRDWTRLIPFVAAFVVSMIPQLIWNWKMFGNPLILGYSFRGADYRGFEVDQLTDGMMILGSTHQQLIALSALALFIGNRKYPHVCTLLSLLIVPTLVFYSGYHAVGQNPIRFILLPLTAMMAACALLMASGETSLAEKRLIVLAILTSIIIIPGMPISAYLMTVPSWLGPVVCGGAAILSFVVARQMKFPKFLVVMAVGYPPITIGYLVIVCLYVVGAEMTNRNEPMFEPLAIG